MPKILRILKKPELLMSLVMIFYFGTTFCQIEATAFDSIAAPTPIIVDLGAKGTAISPSMYGVFFEEINHADDGGLYAELVRNRSFENGEIPKGYHMKGSILVPPLVPNQLTGKPTQIPDYKLKYDADTLSGWRIAVDQPGTVSYKVVKTKPYDRRAANSLQLNLLHSDTKVDLIDSGYWGMHIEAGTCYHLRVILRTSSDFNGGAKVSLRAASSDKILSITPLILKTMPGWQDIRLDIRPAVGDSTAILALQLRGQGSIWLDYVSLFPDHTFKNRKNGLRADVAQKIADLKPAFIRWPGGTVVGGITLSTRYQWKQTLGDPAKRPGEAFTWGYRSSYGLGYFEMLQFAEDIGADFMYVCNAGMGDQHRMGDACPDSSLGFYINDCLDAIEYAIGPITSTWGAKRAAAGHPGPFSLKYVEVGNEQGGRIYDQRFKLFYSAIKNRYPGIQVINNHGAPKKLRTTSSPTDFYDPHYYGSVKRFYDQVHIFDSMPRGDYHVYVGEYACNSKVGAGNMAAALSEAAFITGMEKNSDLVTMTSYAPLLQNIQDRKWPVNLIWINPTSVVGRSSYYVQLMTSMNRPDYNVYNDFNLNGNKGRARHQFLATGYDKQSGEMIIKFVNSAGVSYRTDFKIKGVMSDLGTIKVITLAAKSDKEENSFSAPRKIFPQIGYTQTKGRHFIYSFKPFSYTVLRVKIKN